MSKIRAIVTALRLDKLTNLITKDPLEIISYYLMIALNILMMAFIVWLFKWFLYVSC